MRRDDGGGKFLFVVLPILATVIIAVIGYNYRLDAGQIDRAEYDKDQQTIKATLSTIETKIDKISDQQIRAQVEMAVACASVRNLEQQLLKRTRNMNP